MGVLWRAVQTYIERLEDVKCMSRTADRYDLPPLNVIKERQKEMAFVAIHILQPIKLHLTVDDMPV